MPILICLCDIEAQQVYWQLVTKETAVPTGNGFKIKVPRSQRVDTESLCALKDALTPVIPANCYTVFKTKDVSFNGAKRYVFRVVVNGAANKAEVATIARQVTREGTKSRYHRSRLAYANDGAIRMPTSSGPSYTQVLKTTPERFPYAKSE